MALLHGDPGKEHLFAFRLRVLADYRIPPHWHPVDEHVTGGFFSMPGRGPTRPRAVSRGRPPWYDLPAKEVFP